MEGEGKARKEEGEEGREKEEGGEKTPWHLPTATESPLNTDHHLQGQEWVLRVGESAFWHILLPLLLKGLTSPAG